MFLDFFWLELKQRFKSVSTYVFFLMPFAMMFFTVESSSAWLVAVASVPTIEL